jgi:hypothetical protein
MQRRLTVTRIFALKPYENIQFTNELIKDGAELDERESYEVLVNQIYEAELDHRELRIKLNETETIDEQREVLKDGRD